MILDVLHATPPTHGRSPVADALEPRSASIVDGLCRHLGAPDRERAARAEAAVLADRSDLGVLDLRLSDGSGPRGSAAAEPVAGGWWCRITDDRALLVAPRAPLRTERDRRLADGEDVVDLSPGHAALTVAGPLAREALARATSLDLRPDRTPVGSFRPGSLAHVPATVLREGDDQYLVLVGASHALHVWAVLADAVGGLGGRPGGLDALQIPDRQEAARA